MTYNNAHAAKIDENGIVREVIVIPHLDDDDAKITAYCNRIGIAGTWVDTSYTGSRRGKYAGVGDLFHEEARSGEGEFVSPGAEPEPEPEPSEPEPEPEDGAFVYTSGAATTPAQGGCRMQREYVTVHAIDKNGEEIEGSFQQIVNMKIPSLDFDKDFLVCQFKDSSATKKLIYGPGHDSYSDIINNPTEVQLNIRSNVLWTNQVIPAYHQSSSSTSGDGYTYYSSNELRVNGRDKEGNAWPIITPGMKFRGVDSAGNEKPIVQVLEVKESTGSYLIVKLDQDPRLPVFQNGLTLVRVDA